MIALLYHDRGWRLITPVALFQSYYLPHHSHVYIGCMITSLVRLHQSYGYISEERSKLVSSQIIVSSFLVFRFNINSNTPRL